MHVSQFFPIPDSLVGLASEHGPAFAILVEKETQTIMLYEYEDDSFALKYKFPCSTGEVAGRKQQTGDRKTPEGIYFFTKMFEKKYLSPIYGTRAFVMDYPNFLDRKSGREGNNIWLHGSDKLIKPRDSNGCVVLNNDDLEVLSQYIELNRTPIIIRQRFNFEPVKSRKADQKRLIDFLNAWKTAFLEGDQTGFKACYSRPSEEVDALWNRWSGIRTTWEQAKIPFDMSLQDMTLLQGNPSIVALFDEVVHVDTQTTTIGTKKLFIEKKGDGWKIMGEVYQPDNPEDSASESLIGVLSHLGRVHTDQKAISDLIAEWANAWSSKDIERYAACYAPDFQAREMDLKDWIHYKETLNRLYDSIQVQIEDLRIDQGPEQGTATFLQRYKSTGYQAVGIKHLELKRIGGAWKIHRETWRSIQN